MSLERYIEDVDFAGDIVQTELFRPPYAQITRAQMRAVAKRYKIIMWDIVSRDYNQRLSREGCVNGVLKYISAGSIIAFHDSDKAFRNMSYALPRTLEHVKAMGLECKAIEL